MEEFAKLVVQTGSLETIASVHDQYLDFVCLERNLFSLSKADSYALYNGSGATEQMMEQFMTEIAYGLFSVVASMASVPIIRCPHVSALALLCCEALLEEEVVNVAPEERGASSKSQPSLSLSLHFVFVYRAALPKWWLVS